MYGPRSSYDKQTLDEMKHNKIAKKERDLNPPTPQMPKPDLLLYPGDKIELIPPTDPFRSWRVNREIGTTTIEQFALDMQAERDECKPYKDALEDVAVCDWIADGHWSDPKKLIAAIIDYNQKIALDPTVSKEARKLRDTYKEKADRVEELEKALRMIKDQRMGCGGNLTTDEVLKAIEHIAEQALTNPGEKGAEG